MDHAGATEIGPWGGSVQPMVQAYTLSNRSSLQSFLPLENRNGLGLNEDYRELVLTSLGRVGAPVLRYRTGDIVCPRFEPTSGIHFVRLEGGYLVGQMICLL